VTDRPTKQLARWTSKEHKRSPRKRLALFFDGTWNEPGDHTNVRRLMLMLADHGTDGIPQKAFYDEGVGTRWYDRASGGAFGAGLSKNVRSGYRWLVENYSWQDEIYIFGFSRGAFTARSLAGLIARCGLLKPQARISFAQLYERYQKGDMVRPIYKIRKDWANRRKFDFEETALLYHSYYAPGIIKMVGVWDTVGSIGVPVGNFRGISRRALWFHNTRLSTTIEHSYQALALDEYRKPYWAVLWTDFVRERSDPTKQKYDHRFVEQRWFAGAHANVGGGYRSDLLPDRPLEWLQTKAIACGLTFRTTVKARESYFTAVVHDSYSNFLRGSWKYFTFGRRYVRRVMADPVYKQSRKTIGGQPICGWVQTANERIDITVIQRCQRNSKYRPRSLVEWAKRRKLNLEDIILHPEKYNYWDAVATPGIENTVPPKDDAGDKPRLGRFKRMIGWLKSKVGKRGDV
jgi:uncharacterized protein (DUF2235 family)